MAQETRSDRQLMRQRGAGSRQINNVNFGISFLDQGRRSRSKTPRTATPRRTSREPSLALRDGEGSRQVSLPPLPPLPEAPSGSISNPARRLSKRRRLSEVSDVTVPRSDLPNLQSTHEFQITTDVPEPHTEDMAIARHTVLDALPSSPLFGSRSDVDKENEPVEELEATSLATHARAPSKPNTKKRKRKSIGQQSLRKKKRPSTDSVRSATNGLHPTVLNPAPLAQQSRDEEQEEGDGEQETYVPARQALASRSQEQTHKRRKKRKSVTYDSTRKKRRSSGNPTRIFHAPQSSLDASHTTNHLSTKHAVTVTIDNQPSKRTGKSTLIKDSPLREPTQEPIESEDELDPEGPDSAFIPDDADLEPPTPAPTRRTKSRKSRATSSEESSQIDPSARSAHRGNAFPITTYHLANHSALPTIPEERDEDELHASDEDENAHSRIPPALRSSTQPNAIDVLSQTAHELILSAMDNLSTNSHTSASKIKQAKQALNSFRSTLMNNLLSLSATYAHRQTLESRVRKSAKEKAELQARWLEIRQQRDMLDLKKDRVRREHWEVERSAKEAWEVSEAARKIELTLDADHAQPNENTDLEFALRTVAGDVSCKGSGGGVLERVRALNELLEGFAAKLERR